MSYIQVTDWISCFYGHSESSVRFLDFCSCLFLFYFSSSSKSFTSRFLYQEMFVSCSLLTSHPWLFYCYSFFFFFFIPFGNADPCIPSLDWCVTTQIPGWTSIHHMRMHEWAWVSTCFTSITHRLVSTNSWISIICERWSRVKDVLSKEIFLSKEVSYI